MRQEVGGVGDLLVARPLWRITHEICRWRVDSQWKILRLRNLEKLFIVPLQAPKFSHLSVDIA
jgi:hypothetical protein